MLSEILSALSSKLNRKDVCDLCMEFCKRYDKYEDDKLSKFSSTYSEDTGCNVVIEYYNESACLIDTLPFATFEDDYRTLMQIVLQTVFKTSRNVANDIIDNLGYGNWKHLWTTHDESEQSTGQIVNALVEEIFYCSDRWTWDRVLRCNWLYLRLANEVRRIKIWENWEHSTVRLQILEEAAQDIASHTQACQTLDSDTDQIVNQMLMDIYAELDTLDTNEVTTEQKEEYIDDIATSSYNCNYDNHDVIDFD